MLHVTWILFVTFYLKFSVFSFLKMHVFSTLRTESVNSNVAWDVCLLIFSSVLYVKIMSVKEKYTRMNVDTSLLD